LVRERGREASSLRTARRETRETYSSCVTASTFHSRM
jgi:hypothetical protein